MTLRITKVGAIRSRKSNRGRPATPFLRERVLDSATALFAERDFDQVLVDDVAARAGVGKGSVYRRFGSKEELYAAVVIAGFDQLQEQIRGALLGAIATRERLLTIIRLGLDFFWNRLQFFTLLRDPKALPRRQGRTYHEQREKLSRMISDVIRDGIRVGDIRAELDSHLAAESMLGMMRGLTRYGRQFTTPQSAAEVILKIFLDGCATNNPAHAASRATVPRVA